MKTIYRLLLNLILASILLVGCSDREVIDDLDLPELEPLPEIDQGAVEDAAPKFEGDWTFEMVGVAEFNIVEGMLESEWDGEFSVGSDGKVAGEGSGTFMGEIFAVDDDGCGTKWSVTGTFDFSIEGSVNQDGKTIQVSLSPILSDLSEGALTATCADTPVRDLPPGYSNVHVDNLLQFTSGAGSVLGMHLEPNEPVTGKQFNATVTLVIAWKIPLVPLAPDN